MSIKVMSAAKIIGAITSFAIDNMSKAEPLAIVEKHLPALDDLSEQGKTELVRLLEQFTQGDDVSHFALTSSMSLSVMVLMVLMVALETPMPYRPDRAAFPTQTRRCCFSPSSWICRFDACRQPRLPGETQVPPPVPPRSTASPTAAESRLCP
jgi:hypothetical protein